MPVSIEPLRRTDAPARESLSRLAFGTTDAPDPERPLPLAEHVVAAYIDNELCAAATFHEDNQWICGRRVRMGGVAGVTVAPHTRGRGLARAVLRAGLHNMRERGDAVASLYPTTGTLYRSLGWGYAGSYAWHRIELGDLPAASAGTGYDVTPAGFAESRALYDSVAPTHNGWLARSAQHWTVSEHDHGRAMAAHEAYLFVRGGLTVGFLAFAAQRESSRRFDLAASQLFALDRDAYRAIFGFVQSMGSTAGALRTRIPDYVLYATLDHGHRAERVHSHPNMARIVDARNAISSRGYSPHVDAEVHLDLHDPHLENNDGPFVLRVRDGVGSLEPGGHATIGVTIADFSVAYMGGPCTIGSLVGVFSTPTAPSMIDFF